MTPPAPELVDRVALALCDAEYKSGEQSLKAFYREQAKIVIPIIESALLREMREPTIAMPVAPLIEPYSHLVNPEPVAPPAGERREKNCIKCGRELYQTEGFGSYRYCCDCGDEELPEIVTFPGGWIEINPIDSGPTGGPPARGRRAARMPAPESEMTPEECQRKWELPYDHPESWVQENATYRQIYAAAHATGMEEAAKIAEERTPKGWTDYGIAAAIRSRIKDA